MLPSLLIIPSPTNNSLGLARRAHLLPLRNNHVEIHYQYIGFTLNFLCSFSYAGIVIESTRYLYKEGTREISAQVENKDEMPYLIKSWVESAEGQAPSFLATPPLFRLEAKQKKYLKVICNTEYQGAFRS